MIIHSSHLALRFYKHHGWTKEILEKYLRCGRVIDQREGQEVRDYFWLDHLQGSQIDAGRLYNDLKPRVFTWEYRDGEGYTEVVGEAAVSYMEDHNW